MKLLWLDLETTGLDFTTGAILEVGVIVTERKEYDFGRTMDPYSQVARGHWVAPYDGREMDPKVTEMHTNSGLLTECAEFGIPVEAIEVGLLSFLTVHGLTRPYLAGAGIAAFDRVWLKYHMPRFADACHYRSLDVSTFRVEAELLGLDCPKKREAHRALDDLDDAIALARWSAERRPIVA